MRNKSLKELEVICKFDNGVYYLEDGDQYYVNEKEDKLECLTDEKIYEIFNKILDNNKIISFIVL